MQDDREAQDVSARENAQNSPRLVLLLLLLLLLLLILLLLLLPQLYADSSSGSISEPLLSRRLRLLLQWRRSRVTSQAFSSPSKSSQTDNWKRNCG